MEAVSLPADHYIQALLDAPVFGLQQVEREQLFLLRLNFLSEFHVKSCPSYSRILEAFHLSPVVERLADAPFLLARVFKHLELSSVSASSHFKTITSSGTTGDPSRILLDRGTAALQNKVLVRILQEFVGRDRLPMLIVDAPPLAREKAQFSARSAGSLGLSFIGRDHHFALDDALNINWKVVNDFVARYARERVVIFGFTFLLWQKFFTAIRNCNEQFVFPKGVLFHTGGWKKLQALAVDNETFKKEVQATLEIARVHNFYGMAEQVGSVFVECESGHLHTSVFSDVVVRDATTFLPVNDGEPGLIQVLSCIPMSYPGHSILTEDVGFVVGVDNCPCGRMGKYFRVSGRMAGSELRGCSDVFN